MSKVYLYFPENPGTSFHPIVGRSGRIYGQAVMNSKLGVLAFEMSLEDFNKDKADIFGKSRNPRPFIPTFEPDHEKWLTEQLATPEGRERIAKLVFPGTKAMVFDAAAVADAVEKVSIDTTREPEQVPAPSKIPGHTNESLAGLHYAKLKVLATELGLDVQIIKETVGPGNAPIIDAILKAQDLQFNRGNFRGGK